MGLLDPPKIHDLMSGQRHGLAAAALRGLLRLAELPYTLAVQQRNRRYDRHASTLIQHVKAPVISVGNLTTGGTGKTPLVAWLARWFRQQGLRVALISRGYKAEGGALNDEALELELQLPDVPHLQNADRVEAARVAINEFDSQLILLDDGFQHRRIHRDLDLVLLDAVEPFGYGHLLPRGLLRETLSGLRRADVVVLSRADFVDQRQRDEIRQVVQRHAPTALWVEVSHQPTQLRNASGKTAPHAPWLSKAAAAFCGIGNPEGFRHTLSQCGFRLSGFRAFADHYAFQRADVDALGQWGKDSGADYLLCTGKDLVKIGVDQIQGLPLWALCVQVHVDQGLEALQERLRQVLRIG